MLGLKKYCKHEYKKYEDAAKCILIDAEKLEKNELKTEIFEVFKNLIYEGEHFLAILEVLQKAYWEFKQNEKKGLETPEEVMYVKKQVELTNNLIRRAYCELSLEGRRVKFGPKECKVNPYGLTF